MLLQDKHQLETKELLLEAMLLRTKEQLLVVTLLLVTKELLLEDTYQLETKYLLLEDMLLETKEQLLEDTYQLETQPPDRHQPAELVTPVLIQDSSRCWEVYIPAVSIS